MLAVTRILLLRLKRRRDTKTQRIVQDTNALKQKKANGRMTRAAA